MSTRLHRFTARIAQEGDLYVAQCVEVDVASQGPTVEAAVAALREALELRFDGEPVPSDLPTVERFDVAV